MDENPYQTPKTPSTKPTPTVSFNDWLGRSQGVIGPPINWLVLAIVLVLSIAAVAGVLYDLGFFRARP
jgi:hypothetical protein